MKEDVNAGYTDSEIAAMQAAARPARKPTVEEAEAILILVRGGWLRLELTLDTTVTPPGGS